MLLAYSENSDLLATEDIARFLKDVLAAVVGNMELFRFPRRRKSDDSEINSRHHAKSCSAGGRRFREFIVEFIRRLGVRG